MKLRERQAAQTRELIVDTALALFLENGYERTTMEEVAKRAGVGTTTLYRYFPSKDLLIISPLEMHGQMALALRSRPPGEPLDQALGHALEALLLTPRADEKRRSQIDRVMAATPALSVRLFEEFRKERALLESAVAERMNRPPDDVFCIVSARLATVLLELAAELGSKSAAESSNYGARTLSIVRALMAQLEVEPPAIPRIAPA